MNEINALQIILTGYRPWGAKESGMLVRFNPAEPTTYLERLRLALDTIFMREAVEFKQHFTQENYDASTTFQVHEYRLPEGNCGILQSGESTGQTDTNSMHTLPGEQCNSSHSGDVTSKVQGPSKETQEELDANL